jgi:hypothetical protein
MENRSQNIVNQEVLKLRKAIKAILAYRGAEHSVMLRPYSAVPTNAHTQQHTQTKQQIIVSLRDAVSFK